MDTVEHVERTESRRARTGLVSSRSGDKTIQVMTNNLQQHPRYGKFIRRRKKLTVHDPENQAAVGDLVEIVPCRRLSKTKAWRLKRIIRTAAAAAHLPEEPATTEPAATTDEG